MSDRLSEKDLGDLFVNRDEELEKFSPKGRRSYFQWALDRIRFIAQSWAAAHRQNGCPA